MNPKAQILEVDADSSKDGLNPVRHFARQPILDAKGGLFAYELLFRSGQENRFFDDGNQATRIMLDNTLMFGLEQLSSGFPIFVNCTKESLLEDLVLVLNPEKAVLEVLEHLVVSEALVEACRKLHAKGYRLALDDFSWSPAMAPLVEIADFIKIDVLAEPAEERRRLIRILGRTQLQWIAERVETQEQFEILKGEGFSYFQGHYFCRPVQGALRRAPSNTIMYLQLLDLVQRNPIDIQTAGRMLRQDASLTFRLLRLVNSPVYAIQKEIHSIEQALLIVGDQMFRRLVFLAISGAAAGPEGTALLRLALHRARFCEVVAKLWRLDSDEQCLLGLVSLLPAILKVKMENIVDVMPMRPAFREALMGAKVRERLPLSWMESFESGDWEACASIELASGIPESKLAIPYAEAIRWADDAGGELH
jgi:EAL and modified HD-GYP domain-containing signal transduction protein